MGSNKHSHLKTSKNRRALQTNTHKYYIAIIKSQIYVQTKENIATDPLQTHTSRKSTGHTQHTQKTNTARQRLPPTHAQKQTYNMHENRRKTENSIKRQNKQDIGGS